MNVELAREGLVRGFGDARLPKQPHRRRAWRELCGIVGDERISKSGENAVPVPHQIALDVARAMAFKNCRAWDSEERRVKLAQLATVLARVFPDDGSSSTVRGQYYQGLHDVASILLLGCGQQHAPATLAHIIDSMSLPYARGGVPLALDVLELMMTLLRHVDPQLHTHILSSGVAPHWGLSWMLTWFAHDVADSAVGIRLFDAFLAGHPVLPVYVAAVLLHTHRGSILALDPDDTGPFHQHLKGLPSHMELEGVDSLLAEVTAVYRRYPPQSLLFHPSVNPTAAKMLPQLREHWPELLSYHDKHPDPLLPTGLLSSLLMRHDATWRAYHHEWLDVPSTMKRLLPRRGTLASVLLPASIAVVAVAIGWWWRSHHRHQRPLLIKDG